MSDQELKEMLKIFKMLGKEHAASPAKALAFLVKAGIATKSGKLAKRYRPSA